MSHSHLTTTMAALVVVSSLAAVTSDANAKGVRQICDPRNVCFYCTRGTPSCEASYALSRVFTPPGATPNMHAILPPSPAPSHGRLYPERAYGAVPPPEPVPSPPSKNTMPPPMHSPLSREAERENVIRQGEAFCAKYPDDKMCHPLPEAPPR